MEKGRRQWKNVFVGKNPDTGRPYFGRVKVPVLKPGETPPEPPDMETLPPVEPNEKTHTPSPEEQSNVRPSLVPPRDVGIPKWQEKDVED
jgi:hypothetical protein